MNDATLLHAEQRSCGKDTSEKPRGSQDALAYRRISCLIVVFVVTVLFFQHWRQQEMENSWQSATATIEDVRPVVVSQVNNQFGGAMLYQAEVLAHYNANGFEQRRWIRIERSARTQSRQEPNGSLEGQTVRRSMESFATGSSSSGVELSAAIFEGVTPWQP